jgi:signal transduction histidine kinase
MSRISLRAALVVCVLALLSLTAGAATAGYLVELHSQRADRDHRLAAAATYVKHEAADLDHRLTRRETERWQQALTRKLAALRLSAHLAIVTPTSKRTIYPSSQLRRTTKVSARRSTDDSSATGRSTPSAARSKPPTSPGDPTDPAAERPAATYVFPLGSASGAALRLDLSVSAKSPDQTRRLLVAVASGLAALFVGSMLLIAAVSRWLVAPLRRLNTQVDAIAGGDRIDARATSPIREVQNVAAAVEGMAARLTQTAEHDARLEAERRLLVGSIAHDLRTPLFSLRGYLDAIAAGLGSPQERLDRAREKAQQIDRLITGLFDYARAEIDTQPRLQTTSLADAATDATATFELAAREREVKLLVTAHDDPSVTIDPDGFERALANVIDNALRHAPPGGIVNITCGEDDDGAFVRVIDDGPGIAPDLLPHIFEPMVRADGARNGRTGGAGLGLTIAARLLQSQGGTIHAANAPEHGAILTLRLPRKAA